MLKTEDVSSPKNTFVAGLSVNDASGSHAKRWHETGRLVGIMRSSENFSSGQQASLCSAKLSSTRKTSS